VSGGKAASEDATAKHPTRQRSPTMPTLTVYRPGSYHAAVQVAIPDDRPVILDTPLHRAMDAAARAIGLPHPHVQCVEPRGPGQYRVRFIGERVNPTIPPIPGPVYWAEVE
jgi:hypothetical protein